MDIVKEHRIIIHRSTHFVFVIRVSCLQFTRLTLCPKTLYFLNQQFDLVSNVHTGLNLVRVVGEWVNVSLGTSINEYCSREREEGKRDETRKWTGRFVVVDVYRYFSMTHFEYILHYGTTKNSVILRFT